MLTQMRKEKTTNKKRERSWSLVTWAVSIIFIFVSCKSAAQNTPQPPIKETEDQPISSLLVTKTSSPQPSLSKTTTPTQETPKEEGDDSIAVLEPSLTAADCLAAGVPEIACTGVSANDQWVPVIRELGGVPMALVPAGCYMMGSSDEQIDQYLTMMDLPSLYSDEQPAHLQCFQEPFWIDVYEVTNDYYGSYGLWQEKNQPRESVTWFEATAYCSTRGAHLPSEVEWEYAARGPDNLIYPWGNTFDGSRLNYCDTNCQTPGFDPDHDDGYATTAPVGSYPAGASWVGALDMAGNVWEWVSTSLQPYPYRPDDGREVNPDDLGPSSTIMLRGGGRLDPDYVVRSANRNQRMAHFYDGRFGLRCARPFSPESDRELTTQPQPEMVMEPPSAPGPGDTWTRPFDGAVMVFVPGGTFQMGISGDLAASADTHESPEHPVQLDGFWIDKTLVDTKQFAEFLYLRGNQVENGVPWYDAESEFNHLQLRLDFYKPLMGFEDHPVISVSWYGAQAYCDWVGGRLLTEAEWEYAASGPQNRIYPWGNEYDCSKGNFHDCLDEGANSEECGCDGFDFTSPVDAFPGGASWAGVLDMSGNVWEWVADWGVSPYPADLQVNPTGPEAGPNKVVRGGSWDNYLWSARTTKREDYNPSMHSPTIGFRCAYPVVP